MKLKYVTTGGEVVRDAFNAERLPNVGEPYRCDGKDFEVKSFSTEDSGKPGEIPITVVTLGPANSPKGARPAHGKKQLNG